MRRPINTSRKLPSMIYMIFLLRVNFFFMQNAFNSQTSKYQLHPLSSLFYIMFRNIVTVYTGTIRGPDFALEAT